LRRRILKEKEKKERVKEEMQIVKELMAIKLKVSNN